MTEGEPVTEPRGDRRGGCLPFEYARADRPLQLELRGLERPRGRQMLEGTRWLLSRAQRARVRGRRTPGPRGQLYWRRENTTDAQG